LAILSLVISGSDILTSPEINIGRFCKSGANPYPEKLFPWR
jgi:hypothetical protein